MPGSCGRNADASLEHLPSVCSEDASLKLRVQSKLKGEGLYSPTPNPKNPVHLEVYEILKRGLDSLSENDYGRPWPNPNRSKLKRLTASHERDLCLRAAREVREIVQAQDRAPNITSLYEKKLAEVAATRKVVRDSLGAA